jgi:hypothetical protein
LYGWLEYARFRRGDSVGWYDPFFSACETLELFPQLDDREVDTLYKSYYGHQSQENEERIKTLAGLTGRLPAFDYDRMRDMVQEMVEGIYEKFDEADEEHDPVERRRKMQQLSFSFPHEPFPGVKGIEAPGLERPKPEYDSAKVQKIYDTLIEFGNVRAIMSMEKETGFRPEFASVDHLQRAADAKFKECPMSEEVEYLMGFGVKPGRDAVLLAYEGASTRDYPLCDIVRIFEMTGRDPGGYLYEAITRCATRNLDPFNDKEALAKAASLGMPIDPERIREIERGCFDADRYSKVSMLKEAFSVDPQIKVEKVERHYYRHNYPSHMWVVELIYKATGQEPPPPVLLNLKLFKGDVEGAVGVMDSGSFEMSGDDAEIGRWLRCMSEGRKASGMPEEVE